MVTYDMELPPGWSAAPLPARPPTHHSRHQPAQTARENFSNLFFIPELSILDKIFRDILVSCLLQGDARAPDFDRSYPHRFLPKLFPAQPAMLKGFQCQTGQAEDGGLGLKPSPYDQVVLWLGRGSAEVGGVADQTLDQRRRHHCVPPGGDVISGRIMRADML